MLGFRQFIRQKFTENCCTLSSSPRKFGNVPVDVEAIVARVVSEAPLGENFSITHKLTSTESNRLLSMAAEIAEVL